MRLLFSLMLLVICVSTAAAQPLEQRYAEYGKLLLLQLPTSPFPHPVRTEGHTYRDKKFPAALHYSDSTVAVFVPNGFREGEAVDIVVHIHGWYNNVDSVLAQFKLIEQFAASKKNAILVVPQGPKNAPDSFGGRLEDKNGFRAFISDIMKALRKEGIIKIAPAGSIILSGHSGAYRMISYILLRGGLLNRIKEVYLFDALYAETEKYAHWITNQNGRLIAIYTEDGGTKGETEGLIEDLKEWGVKYFAAPDTVITPKQLRGNKIVFLATSLGHNQVIAARQQFRQYLEASVLKNRKK